MLILNALKINRGEIEEIVAKAIFRRTIWTLQYGVTYEQFIGFLVQSGLIEYYNDKIRLLPLGQTFIDYLVNNNIPLKLPANDMVEMFSKVEFKE